MPVLGFISSNPAKIGFATEPLRDMAAVGAITARSARLWIRSERPGRIAVEYWPRSDPDEKRSAAVRIDGKSRADGTSCLTLEPLRARERYAYSVRRSGGETLGRGGFETAPAGSADAPERFAFAVTSCHQPFDSRGVVKAAAQDMLAAARESLERHSAKFVLAMGDQMYTDYPKRLSLFDEAYFASIAPAGRSGIRDCTAAEVRRLLQMRHRYFWNVEGWRALHADYPCYPILDDHEILDNWGSVDSHDTRAWQPFLEGARAAYFDYQGSRVSDRADAGDDFDYEVEYGPMAAYVLDLRSNRRTGAAPRAFSRDQETRFCRFLDKNGGRDALFVVLSVPAIHLPTWGAKIASWVTPENEDFSDRWSTAGHARDRDRLLTHLHRHQKRHPDQRIALLSGDIHIACAHEIVWRDGTRPLLQLISSGITHRVGLPTQIASKYSMLANKKIVVEEGKLEARVQPLNAVPKLAENPYTKLNLGVVELERTPSGRYAMRYLIYGRRGRRPVCKYQSAWH